MALRNLSPVIVCVIALTTFVAAAPSKTHVITFGRWSVVQYCPESEGKPVSLKVRPMRVDARIKEFTMGAVHDVTDRLFVVQRVFRVNDSLPDDSIPQWQWQPGTWLLVDRTTGRVSTVNLPDFDPFFSTSSWYRDYAAYCGVSDDGKKVYALVVQIGRHKPMLKKLILENDPERKEELAVQACSTPGWERSPARVTFSPGRGPRQTFAIRGHTVDTLPETQDEEEDATK